MNQQHHDRPLIVAHRGAMREAPENTRAAFERALESPIDGVEFDVQMTADGVCVLHHDETTRRVTGAAGSRISKLVYDDLCRAEWGSWFSTEFAGERIMTLEAMLDSFAERTRLLVEIKSFAYEADTGQDVRLTRSVLAALTANSTTYVLSFDRHILELAFAELPGLQCVLNTNDPKVDMKQNYGADYVFAYSTSINRVSRDWVAFARDRDKKTMTWSCNKPREVDKALEHGVDVIMSDRPAWITQYLHDTHGWTF